VDTVNGKRLAQPVSIIVENLNSENSLPQQGRVIIKGYESGRMIGTPPGAIAAAKEAKKEITMPQAGWQFYRFFVLTSWVQLKKLEKQKDSVEQTLPGEHVITIHVGKLARHYTVHVPPGYDGKTSMPIVIMLHGGGGTGKAAATETGWGAKADEAGFLAVFPDAMPPDQTKQSHFSKNPQLWNDGSERFYSGQKAVDDVGFLNAILDDLLARYTVDQRRIYVVGFSNGASMSFRIGAELSERIAAIAPVAGALWVEPPTLNHPVAMIYITGTADPLNLIEGGVPKLATGSSDKVRAKAKPPVRDSILKWAKMLGCPATPRNTSEASGVHTESYGPGRDDAEVVYITVEGLGHNWAGGKSLLPEFMVGKLSDKIRATDVIWEFFQKHPKKVNP
jgi:polyhydroxybutyrate depolymerase